MEIGNWEGLYKNTDYIYICEAVEVSIEIADFLN